MNVTLHGNVELYVKRLVDLGAFPSAESAVNSLVAQMATSNGLPPHLSSIGDVEEQPKIDTSRPTPPKNGDIGN